MEACEIKWITDNAVINIPGDVCFLRTSRVSLRVETRPVAVKSTASLLRGYLDTDYIGICQSWSSWKDKVKEDVPFT